MLTSGVRFTIVHQKYLKLLHDKRLIITLVSLRCIYGVFDTVLNKLNYVPIVYHQNQHLAYAKLKME